MRYDYGYPVANTMMWGGALSGLLSLLFFVLIVMLILRLFRHGHGYYGHYWQEHQHSSSKTAHDILSERYAKGEITKTEYESMKKDITA